MKTLKTIIVTAMVTMVMAMVGVVSFLFNDGNITIEKRDTNHEKVVMIDGVVTESRSWNELLGYEISINVLDGAYIGR